MIVRMHDILVNNTSEAKVEVCADIALIPGGFPAKGTPLNSKRQPLDIYR